MAAKKEEMYRLRQTVNFEERPMEEVTKKKVSASHFLAPVCSCSDKCETLLGNMLNFPDYCFV